jgi:acyl-CoA reductase-like NAD-dependent aldehyde dehydrogenase
MSVVDHLSTNPADVSDVVWSGPLGDADTFMAAARAARAAQPGWAATPAPRRGRAIQQIGRIVEANKEALARLVTREIGKPYPEALGEVQEIVDTCDFFLGEGRRLYGQTMIDEKFLQHFLDHHLGLIAGHHAVSGSTGVGRITTDNPRTGFVGDCERGLYVHPTIVAGVRIDDELANTETFGPLVGVAKYGSFDEAIAFANGHGYGLSSAIYTNNPSSALRFRERVSAGMVSVNNSTSGAEAHLPFGGNGKSGNGSRQSGVWVLDQFTRWQSMNWDYAGKLQKAQMDVDDVDADLGFRLED